MNKCGLTAFSPEKTMAYILGKFLDRFQNVLGLTDKKCMICQADIFDTNVGICDRCLKTCTLNSKKTCVRCGSSIEGDNEFCGNCSLNNVYFDKAYSAFVYEGGIAGIIQKVKFGGAGAYCKLLANYLVFLQRKNKIEFDTVCYVPMTAKSLRKRGFNQTRLLAEYFCDFLEIENLSHCLKKIRDTEKQEKLTKKDRAENLRNAFAVTDGTNLKGQTILLIDDVKTTGATLSECGKALKKSGGAKRVVCLTIASRKSEL